MEEREEDGDDVVGEPKQPVGEQVVSIFFANSVSRILALSSHSVVRHSLSVIKRDIQHFLHNMMF